MEFSSSPHEIRFHITHSVTPVGRPTSTRWGKETRVTVFARRKRVYTTTKNSPDFLTALGFLSGFGFLNSIGSPRACTTSY
jgi:hypothetical protein